jgi:hypothetical protein
MSLFKRNNGKTTIKVPGWASFFEENEYNAFIKSIHAYFSKTSVTYEIGEAEVKVSPDYYGFHTFGLTNVAQVCKQDKPENYEELVMQHFASMIRSHEFDQEFEKIVDDFDKVKEYLGVRLYHTDYLSQVDKNDLVGKDFAGDIYAALVFDLPDSVQSVDTDKFVKWNKSLDELFEIGIQNIKEKHPSEISQEDFGEFTAFVVQAEHFFVPNIVFDLENNKELIGSKGSLIGLPHRHAALIYPIEDLQVLTAINGLLPTVYGMYEEGPGSVSNNLFWYYEGNFYNLPYESTEDELRFTPPDNFVELLNSLESEQ